MHWIRTRVHVENDRSVVLMFVHFQFFPQKYIDLLNRDMHMACRSVKENI